MKTIIYARRSSERGDDYSLTTQVDACQRYAAGLGLQIVGEVKDNFTGTVHLRERSAGAEVWRQVQRHEVQAVLVYTLDRLSRADLVDALAMMREMMRAGCVVISTESGPIENLNDIGLIVRSWQSSEERRKIVDRLQRGKIGKAAHAWVGVGKPPYACDKVGIKREARLVINEERAAVVRQMVTWLLVDGLPLREIARRLTDRGVPPPTMRATYWRHASIYRILSNRALIGELCFRGVTVVQSEIALLSPDLFDQVQARLGQNRDRSSRNRRHDYLAAGHIQCQCERSMIGSTAHVGGRVYQYYRCSQYAANDGEPVTCVNRRGVKVSDLDARIWQYVLDCAQPERLADWRAELRRSQGARAANPWREKLERIDRDIEQARRRIAGVMIQFGDDARPAVAEQRDKIINEANALIEKKTAERIEAARRADDASGRLAQQEDALTAVEKLRRKLVRANFSQRRQVLEIIDLRVTVRVVRGQQKVNVSSLIGPDVDV